MIDHQSTGPPLKSALSKMYVVDIEVGAFIKQHER